MNSQSVIDDFIETFKPDLNRYVEKGVRGNIITVKRPLTKELITRFFSDVSSYRLSFFVRGAYRNYVGLDIDDHEDGGWNGNIPTDFLRRKFTYVKSVIGEFPSMIFRSPRGIHAFWFLTESLPNQVIENNLNARLFKVEILPTTHHALAIPRPVEYLNTSLEPAMFPGYSRAVPYNPKAILGEDYSPDSIKQRYKSGKAGMEGNKISVLSMKTLEDKEAEYLPIQNGRSNEAYKSLVAFYIARGLNNDQIVQRFKGLVEKSHGYTGDLLRNIETRVASSYRNLKSTIGTIEMGNPGILRGEPKIQKAIEELLLREGVGGQMREAHVNYLLNLISWIRSYDRCQADPERAAYWDYMYPNSLWYYRQGYFPLPHSLQRQWNVHFDKHLRLLKEHGILVESPFGYSTTLKRCKYYRFTVDISQIA